MDAQPIVKAKFNEAYTFKQCIGYLKNICLKAALRIEKDRISVVQVDASATVMVNWDIKTSQLIEYSFNALDERGNLVDLLYVGFEVNELYKTTKSIHKNDSMILILMPGEKSIYINIGDKDQGDRTSLNIVPMIELGPEFYNEIKYQRTDDEPTYRATSEAFGKLCTDLTQLKCNHAIFVGYDTGFTVKGILPSKTIGKIVSFGECSYVENVPKGSDGKTQLDELLKQVKVSKIESKTKGGLKMVVKTKEDLMTIRVPARYIKPMSKFGSLNGKGIMKFIIEENKPLKIIINVGQYSILTILIRDSEC